MLTTQEIRQLTDKDLQNEVAIFSRKLLEIDMELRGNQSAEIHKKHQFRKYIARLKTIEREHQLTTTKAGEAEQSEATPTESNEASGEATTKEEKNAKSK